MIYGKLIDLRPICESDTSKIVKWRNNPSVRNNFIYREQFTAELHDKWITEKVKTGKVVQFIIVEHESLLDIGSVYIRDINTTDKTGEYGIFIGEDSARGKGYGRESAMLMSAYSKEIGLEVLYLRVIKTNHQAINSYLSSGFEPYDEETITTSNNEEVKVQFMRKMLI